MSRPNSGIRWGDLLAVLKDSWGPFILWMAANLGGLIVGYSATFSIWYFHRFTSLLMPSPETFLVTASIVLAVSGVSYLASDHPRQHLSPLLSLSWPLLLAAVYGALIAMGARTPVIGARAIWWTVSFILAACLSWSAVMWLHQRGLQTGVDVDMKAATKAPDELLDTAAKLPKMNRESGSE